MCILDTDCDNRSLYPNQGFSPWQAQKTNEAGSQKNLKAEIDQEKIEAFRGTISLPFARGDNDKIAVKIIDDRDIER